MPITRDPRLCLLAVATAVFSIALFTKTSTAASALALALFLAFRAGLTLAETLRQLRPVFGLVVMVLLFVPWLVPGDSPWSHSLDTAFLLSIKILAIATLLLWPAKVYPWNALAEGLHRLHLPAVVVQILLVAGRYVFVLRDEWQRLRTALATRGFRNRGTIAGYGLWGLVIGQLLLRTHDHAERLTHAMRCRGYGGRLPHLHELKTTLPDIVYAATIVLATSCLWVWDTI